MASDEDRLLEAEELRYLVLALQRQGGRELNALYASLGLTASQAEAVEIIGSHGPLSTKQVGALLICETGSPSRLLSILERKGLTMTSRSIRDRRATLHALTPAGREVYEAVAVATRSFEESLAQRLDTARRNHSGLLGQLRCLLTDPALRGAIDRRFHG